MSVMMRFTSGEVKRGRKPALEYGAWLLTTGAALLITALILYVGADRMGFAVLPVKAAAVAASFFAAYFMRARLLYPRARD